MRILRFSTALILASLALCASASAAETTTVYELRTYTATPGNLPKLLTRFRDHTLKIFERHGIVNVGYWLPTDAKDGADEKLVYLLQHKSRDAAAASWKSFGADPEWKDVSKKSQVDGKIVAKVESVFLSATDYSKLMTAGSGKGATRVFELRTYTTPEGKLGGLDARFRDHTIALFAKHGITNLGYFHPLDADKGAGKTLVYFLAHSSREAASASWKAFQGDADWVKARTASEKDGKLTVKVESVFLKPTDFSPIK
jgi:hypothetical protein